MEFAQRFRLPHNDTWLFRSMTSVESLFDLYDSSRETGLADGVIGALNGIVEGGLCVESMYPHCVVQGNILEGIVIRHVSYSNDDGDGGGCGKELSGSNAEKEHLERMSKLCSQSREILKLVPPNKKITSHAATTKKELLSINLRDVYRNSPDDDSFGLAIESILANADDTRRRTTVVSKVNGPSFLRKADIPQMASNALLSTHGSGGDAVDSETKQIATIIQRLGQLKLKSSVDYKVFEEELMGTDDVLRRRYICVVHVHKDYAFQKYHKATCESNDQMVLYRGFSIELLPPTDEGGCASDYDGVVGGKKSPCIALQERVSNFSTIDSRHGGGTSGYKGKLMIKMKFLPYMVRTFICRNGLRILKNSGLGAFNDYAQRQFTKWDMSESATYQWMPFFESWGVYCESQLQNTTTTASSTTSSYDGSILLPLTATLYIHHYNHFQTLYSNGKAPKPSDMIVPSSFLGIVMVVGVNKKELNALARTISVELGSPRVIDNVADLSPTEMMGALDINRGGFICSVTILEKTKVVQKLIQRYLSGIFMVFVGCSDEEIGVSLDKIEDSDAITYKRTKGIMKQWRKLAGNTNAEVSRLGIFEDGEDDEILPDRLKSNPDLVDVMQKICDKSDAFKEKQRPGLLIIFPVIPGSGKSSLCKDIIPIMLGIEDGREVVVRAGDRVKGKYYRVVETEKYEDPSSIYIADKNGAPSSWRTILDICTKSKGYPIAAVPDSLAFCDTSITSTVEKGSDNIVEIRYDYPYSLHYLAVCMLRVLQREPSTHDGKLDSGCQTACMIVVMFFCLYRDITTEKLLARFTRGNSNSNPVITVPFFAKEELPNLPDVLDKVLRDAISLHYTMTTQGSKSTTQRCAECELHLRNTLILHTDFLQDLTCDEKVSKASFISQISDQVYSLHKSYEEEKIDKVSHVRLVSIDIDYNTVHAVLRVLAEGDSSASKILYNLPDEIVENDDSSNMDRYMIKTHVTLAHSSEMSQEEIQTRFGSLVSLTVEIQVKSLMHSTKVAALEIEVAETSASDPPQILPQTFNDFQHITVWCAKGIRGVESKKLPSGLENGESKKIILDKPVTLKGTITFW